MFSGNVPDGDENVERRDNKKDKDKGYVAFYSDDEDVGVQGDDEAVSGYSASITRFVHILSPFVVTWSARFTFNPLLSSPYRKSSSRNVFETIIKI